MAVPKKRISISKKRIHKKIWKRKGYWTSFTPAYTKTFQGPPHGIQVESDHLFGKKERECDKNESQ